MNPRNRKTVKKRIKIQYQIKRKKKKEKSQRTRKMNNVKIAKKSEDRKTKSKIKSESKINLSKTTEQVQNTKSTKNILNKKLNKNLKNMNKKIINKEKIKIKEKIKKLKRITITSPTKNRNQEKKKIKSMKNITNNKKRKNKNDKINKKIIQSKTRINSNKFTEKEKNKKTRNKNKKKFKQKKKQKTKFKTNKTKIKINKKPILFFFYDFSEPNFSTSVFSNKLQYFSEKINQEIKNREKRSSLGWSSARDRGSNFRKSPKTTELTFINNMKRRSGTIIKSRKRGKEQPLKSTTKQKNMNWNLLNCDVTTEPNSEEQSDQNIQVEQNDKNDKDQNQNINSENERKESDKDSESNKDMSDQDNESKNVKVEQETGAPSHSSNQSKIETSQRKIKNRKRVKKISKPSLKKREIIILPDTSDEEPNDNDVDMDNNPNNNEMKTSELDTTNGKHSPKTNKKEPSQKRKINLKPRKVSKKSKSNAVNTIPEIKIPDYPTFTGFYGIQLHVEEVLISNSRKRQLIVTVNSRLFKYVLDFILDQNYDFEYKVTIDENKVTIPLGPRNVALLFKHITDNTFIRKKFTDNLASNENTLLLPNDIQGLHFRFINNDMVHGTRLLLKKETYNKLFAEDLHQDLKAGIYTLAEQPRRYQGYFNKIDPSAPPEPIRNYMQLLNQMIKYYTKAKEDMDSLLIMKATKPKKEDSTAQVYSLDLRNTGAHPVGNAAVINGNQMLQMKIFNHTSKRYTSGGLQKFHVHVLTSCNHSLFLRCPNQQVKEFFVALFFRSNRMHRPKFYKESSPSSSSDQDQDHNYNQDKNRSYTHNINSNQNDPDVWYLCVTLTKLNKIKLCPTAGNHILSVMYEQRKCIINDENKNSLSSPSSTYKMRNFLNIIITDITKYDNLFIRNIIDELLQKIIP